MEKNDFGPEFLWGAATSAYQIEGAVNEDGRGPCIWDEFAIPKKKRFSGKSKSRIENNDNAETACNHYHMYKEDVSHLASLNMNAYRFSISWSRILPNGTGQFNRQGIQFYHNLIDELLKNNITPFVTLYHWDLPLGLEKKGGWTNRDIVKWFTDYVELCVTEYGSKVNNWIILNESLTYTALGHWLGFQAPGRTGLKNFLPAVHHSLLAQAEAGRLIKKLQPDSQVGTSVAMTLAYPNSNRQKDIKAAERVNAMCRIFVDPIVGRGYPLKELKFLRKIDKYVKDSDMEKLSFPLDFLGVNHYFRMIAKNNSFIPYVRVQGVKPDTKTTRYTDMDWEVNPSAMYDLLMLMGKYKEIPAFYITENGAAYNDIVDKDGNIEDTERAEYYQQYLAEVLRAKKDNVQIKGYFAWSLLDNFEWQSGYKHRFGLIHVDYPTQKRTIKKSGLWFQRFLRNPTETGRT